MLPETESKDRTCEHCRQPFTRQRGTAGKYCRRECWNAARSDAAQRRHAEKPIGKTRRERQSYYSYRWQMNHPERRKASKARYRERHKEKLLAERREYYRQNREKIEERKRKWALENPDLVHAQRVRSNMRKKLKKLGWAISRYDLTAEKYLSMLASQNGGCAICGRTYGNARRRRLAVDHCHSTGVIRGLLCSRCNSVLGYMLDDPQLLRRAADYLESAGGACQTTGASPNGNSFSV